MSITEFKARALREIERVQETCEPLVVTKRGRPVVTVVPYTQPAAEAVPGGLAHLLLFEDDIVSPLGEGMWDAAR